MSGAGGVTAVVPAALAVGRDAGTSSARGVARAPGGNSGST
ncbi:hypothetical protein ACLESO_38275 [Pyxidicoccus sp. 3LG]